MTTSTKTISRAALLLVVFAMIASQSAQAQAPRVGYLDPDPFLPAMPGYQEIQQQLKERQASNQQALQSRADEFQAKVTDYQQQQPQLSPEDRTTREQELQQLQVELQAFAAEKERDLGQKRAELLNPLADKVQKAIDEVAAEKGLDFVLRMPVLLYANESRVVNITLDVARKLGIPVESEPSD